MSTTPYIRQLLVVTAPQLAAVSVGGAIGYPNTLLQQLQRNDTTIELDLASSSWIGSISSFAGIPSILMPSFMQWKGRKIAFLTSCLLISIGWTTVYAARSVTAILISESFHGLGSQCVMLVSFCSMNEMVSPRFRNISIGYYGIWQAIGISITTILGQYCSWKTVALILVIPIILAILTTLFMWPESPSWLAFQGKYIECEANFKWLRGESTAANKELSELLNATKEDNEKLSIFGTIFNRDFYIPAILMFILFAMSYWSGLFVLVVYSPFIVKRTVDDDKVVHYSVIILSVIFSVGFVNVTILMNKMKNKTMILLGTIGVVFSSLFCFLITLLQYLGVLAKSMLCLFGLMFYVLVMVSFLISPSFGVAMEITAVKNRGLGGALYVIFSCLMHFSSMKSAPYMFEYMNLWGAFLVYSLNATICGFIIWKFVPETKNRTLQELEDYFKYGKFIQRCEDDVNDPIVVLEQL